MTDHDPSPPVDPDFGPDQGSGHERYAVDVAGYVLGGLSVDEQHAFEAHLLTCAACRDELSLLDPIPVLLDLPAPAGAPTAPPDASAPSAPAELSTTPLAETVAPNFGHRRRHRRLAIGGAMAVLAVAAAFLIGLMVATPSQLGYSQAVALRPAPAAQGPMPTPDAHGVVAVRPVDHGTEVRLSVSGLPASAGTYYECLWWSADGVRSAGTFTLPATGSARVELTTAAELHPGWRLAILEHPAGRGVPVTVLQTST